MKSVRNIIQSLTRRFFTGETHPELSDLTRLAATSNDGSPARSIEGMEVRGLFIEAGKVSELDRMSGEVAERTLDHLLRKAMDGVKSNSVRMMFTSVPRPDRDLMIWQKKNADIGELISAANAMDVFLSDLGFSRHEPITFSLDSKHENRISIDRDAKAKVSASVEAKTPEFLAGLASAKFGIDGDASIGRKTQNENSAAMIMSDERVIGGWAYDAGLIEAITNKLGIPSPQKLDEASSDEASIRAAILRKTNVEGSFPFENLHDRLMNVERGILDLANGMSDNPERDVLTEPLELGDTQGALELQLARARHAGDQSLEQQAKEEVRLATILCAAVYRGARHNIEEQLGRVVGEKLLYMAREANPDLRRIKLPVSVAFDLDPGAMPAKGLHSVSAIDPKGSEELLALKNIGLQAFYQVSTDPADAGIKIVLFPDMTPRGMNLERSDIGGVADKSQYDSAYTSVSIAKENRAAMKENRALHLDKMMSQLSVRASTDGASGLPNNGPSMNY